MTKNITNEYAVGGESITQDRLAYSVEEISQQTTLSKAFLRNEIRAKRLKVKRCGRRVLILKDDFLNYLNEGEKDDGK